MMERRHSSGPRRLLVAAALLLLVAGAWFGLRRSWPAPPARIPSPPPTGSSPPSSAHLPAHAADRASPGTGLASSTAGAGTTPPPPRSELLDGLNAPTNDIMADLKLMNEVFNAWLTNFRAEGIPIGNNREVTAALTGKNPMQFAFVPPDHPAINTSGELCDRWGTPFRFHVLGRQQMEIRSAGPDRKFGTEDDAEWAPWPKNF